MDANVIDIIFWGFIIAVVLGGLACLVVFLPKEHEFDEEHENCYRIAYRDGSYSVSRKKPVYGENRFSLRSKFFYITRVPFQVTAVCEGAKATDGNEYRCAAVFTVCFPEDRLQTFAPTFHGVSQDTIVETLEEALSAAAEEFLVQYEPSSDEESIKARFKELAQKKLDIFGVYIMSLSSPHISANS